ncbi:MAG: capsule assembly Wzi family protein [Candidatus Korobacteraceae bacterium]
MKRRVAHSFLAVALLVSWIAAPLLAQQQAPAPPTVQSQDNLPAPDGTVPHPNESKFFIHLAEDQKNIWTSPFHLKPDDAKWLVPVSGIATGLFVTDPQSSYAMRLDNQHALNILSDAGVASALGMTGAAYLWGHIAHNERARETGVLATEAIVNAIGVDYALKGITGRERPFPSNFQNVFFHGGTALPSDHAAVTWAFASVVAQEYPHLVPELGAYGLALGVSLARAAADQHFLSDVFIGGVLGYQVGRQIYKQRHNPNIDDDLKIVAEQTSAPRTGNLASVYVPLDNWVYPAMERLIGFGYIDTAFLGLRPWTRMSCAHMLIEMNSKVEYHTDIPSVVWQLKKALDTEFAPELAAWDGRPTSAMQLDSVYTRVTDIAGTPLNDCYHFGQTLINDDGRPYGQGVSNITGLTGSANDGRFAFNVDAEYQHAPSIPAYPLSVREVIANVDLNPLQPPKVIPTTNQLQFLNTYATARYAGLDFSVGNPSMYWGPTESGSLLMSDNAQPFWTIEINRTEPTYIPLLSKLLGPFEADNFFGSLYAHEFPPGPYIFGQKVSFKPTENLELGFTRDDVFGGAGHVPITFGSFWNSFTSFNDVPPAVKFSRNDPGARHASFDFTYRVPGLRRWLTLYSDSLVHDDVNPVSAPRRSAVNPGIYLSHVPGLPKLDFRAEAVYTDPPTPASLGGHFIYWETIYHDLYLNNKFLMGNWIGREGHGYQAWTTYHLSPQSSIQVGVRNAKIANDFIPGGSTEWDWNMSAMLRVRKDLEVKSFLQYETWLLPVLAPTRQSDFTSSVQLTWWPASVGIRRAFHQGSQTIAGASK